MRKVIFCFFIGFSTVFISSAIAMRGDSFSLEDETTRSPKRARVTESEEEFPSNINSPEVARTFFKAILDGFEDTKEEYTDVDPHLLSLAIESKIVTILSPSRSYSLDSRDLEGEESKAFKAFLATNKHHWITVAENSDEDVPSEVIRQRYAELLYFIGEEEEAFQWADKAVDKMLWRIGHRGKGEVYLRPIGISVFLFTTAQDLLHRGKREQGKKWLMLGAKGGDVDCVHLLGDLAMNLEIWEEALGHYMTLCKSPEEEEDRAGKRALSKGVQMLMDKSSKAATKEEGDKFLEIAKQWQEKIIEFFSPQQKDSSDEAEE